MHAISATMLIASVLIRATPAATAGASAQPEVSSPDSSITAAATATPAAASPADDARVADDFSPTSEPPWNPPEPLSRRRTWEQAILLPQRIVTYPLSLLGDGTDWLFRKFENTNYFARLGALDDPVKHRHLAIHPPKRFGYEIGPARLGDHTGLGGRFQVHAPVFPGRWRSLVFAEHSPSTRHYHQTRVGIRGDLGAFEYDYDWRPQDRFYGIGMETSDDGISNFATQFDQFRVTLQYAWNRAENGRPRSNIAIWAGPRSAITKSGREDGVPSIEDVYPTLVATTFRQRHDHFIYGGRLSTDWRSGIPHLSHGWRALIQSERFDEPHGAVGLHTNRGAGAQFTRTQVELESMWSFMRDPRTIRVMGRIVDIGVSNNLPRMEPLDFARLGGSRAGLSGFAAGRFHDFDAVYARVMYIFPLVRRLEMEVHAETGEVTSNLWRDSRFDKLAFSSGFSLRARTGVRPIGRIGMDFSHEGTFVRWSVGGGE
jgi:hypothetical protein